MSVKAAYQMRLPWPRNPHATTCGHPDRPHHALGRCSACYYRQYRSDHIVARMETEAKSKAKHIAARTIITSTVAMTDKELGWIAPRYREVDDDWNLPEEVGLGYAE